MEKDIADDGGVFQFWQKMIALRKNCDVLCEGEFECIQQSGSVYAFARRLGDRKLVSVCNMSGKRAKMPAQVKMPMKLVTSSYPNPEFSVLKPFEFRLLSNFEVEG